jgi:hypothetical protein
MGQNQSCLSAADSGVRAGVSSRGIQHQTEFAGPTAGIQADDSADKYGPRLQNTQTDVTDTMSDEELPDHDSNHGYNLVDLKGDRMHHLEPRTLQGCEVRDSRCYRNISNH